jgi:leucyl aminopeptidase
MEREMNYQVATDEPFLYPCPVLVLGCFEEKLDGPCIAKLDTVLDGAVSALLRTKEFTGKLNSAKVIHTLGRMAAERVLLVGLGKERDFVPDRMRQAAGTAARVLRASSQRAVAFVLPEGAALLQPAAEGYALGEYTFEQYKSEPEKLDRVETVTFLLPDGADRGDAGCVAADAKRVCEAVRFTRDLVAQPGNVATPAYLAEKSHEMAARFGVDCHVWERDEIERRGMHALLAVARGSRQQPRFITLDYRGADEKNRPVVLVGKGITFDSGGISLKPREGMERMKDDMAGAAAVMGIVMAAASLKLPLNVVGLIPAAENLPGGNASKPGDVIRSMSGKTVEIVNTDAEGRLVLCDALHHALSFRPAAVIDLATLTGACVVALGSLATGMMGNDEGLKRALKRSGEATGERVWELPLWEEYGEVMKSDIADLKNAGGPAAGTITAAWFLKNFAGSAKWAHLDIAGTAWEEKGRHYLPKGATGIGVRLLVHYLRGLC